MRRYVHCSVLLSTLLSAGCIPYVSYPYYAPTAQGGTVAIDACGPDRTLEFRFDGAKVDVGASTTDQGVQVGMVFLLPLGHTARLLDDTVTLRLTDGRTFSTKVIEAQRWSRETARMTRQSATETMAGGHDVFTGFGRIVQPYGYMLSGRVVAPAASTFALRVPPFAIDETRRELPEITMSQKTYRRFFAPINC